MDQLKQQMSWTSLLNQIYLVVAMFALKALLDQFTRWINHPSVMVDVSTNTPRRQRMRRKSFTL